MSKADVVEAGVALGLDLTLSYSSSHARKVSFVDMFDLVQVLVQKLGRWSCNTGTKLLVATVGDSSACKNITIRNPRSNLRRVPNLR